MMVVWNSVELEDPYDGTWDEDNVMMPNPRTGGQMLILNKKPTFIGGMNIGMYHQEAYAFSVWTKTHWEIINSTQLQEKRAFYGATEVPVTLFDNCP